jgi:hypothetical protein
MVPRYIKYPTLVDLVVFVLVIAVLSSMMSYLPIFNIAVFLPFEF